MACVGAVFTNANDMQFITQSNTIEIMDMLDLTAHEQRCLFLLQKEYLVFGCIANIESNHPFSINISTDVFNLVPRVIEEFIVDNR